MRRSGPVPRHPPWSTPRPIALVDEWWFGTRSDAWVVEAHGHDVMREWRTPSGWYEFPKLDVDADFAIDHLNELLHW